jgi:hypothetical protein
MTGPYDSFTFTHRGRDFTARLFYDTDSGAPWEEHDGHGPVSDWTTRDKRSGERILNSDRSSRRYYDFAGAVTLAKCDNWGLSPEDLAALTARLGRTPTPAQIATQAAENDFARLKAWCDDKWHWCGIVVTREDDPDMEESLWGIESDSPDYHREVALEMACGMADALEAREGEFARALAGIAYAAAGLPAARVR